MKNTQNKEGQRQRGEYYNTNHNKKQYKTMTTSKNKGQLKTINTHRTSNNHNNNEQG